MTPAFQAIPTLVPGGAPAPTISKEAAQGVLYPVLLRALRGLLFIFCLNRAAGSQHRTLRR
jgi:hypothetical protein